MQNVWTRRQREYLTDLREHHPFQWKQSINKRTAAVDDVILLYDNAPRNQWKLAVNYQETTSWSRWISTIGSLKISSEIIKTK